MEKEAVKRTRSTLFKDSGAHSPDCNSSVEENEDTINDRIVINVGGFRHETFRSTLRVFPDTRLGWIAIKGNSSIDAYDPIREEYFFDRHPHAFAQIINFYRTGKLHAPSDICGPSFEEELSYWGLNEKVMAPCCWSKYTEHRDAEENLAQFDDPSLDPTNDTYTEQLNELRKFNLATSPDKNHGSTHKERLIRVKRALWMLFENHNSSVAARIVSMISLAFILFSVLSLCFHSMLEIVTPAPELQVYLLIALDIACCAWFLIELPIRFFACPEKRAFIRNVMNIIDFLTLITYAFQFYEWWQGELFIRKRTTDYDKWIRVLGIARLFRLFRFFRLSTGLQFLKHTLIASSKELLLLLLLVAIPVAIFATFVFYCENIIHEETKFKTLPESFWWAIITITTVGYGDIVPTTTLGKLLGSVCALCSVLIVALPVSIIGNNFTLYYHYGQARLKQPKMNRNALVGAANALVSDGIQTRSSQGESSVSSSSEASSMSEMKKITDSTRFQRERTSLYTAVVNSKAQKFVEERYMKRSYSEGSIRSTGSSVKNGQVNEAFDVPLTIISPCESPEHLANTAEQNGQPVMDSCLTNDVNSNGVNNNGGTSLPLHFYKKDDVMLNGKNGDVMFNDERKRSNNHLYVPQNTTCEENYIT